MISLVTDDQHIKWRRERDSNPRYSCLHTRFPSVLFKPLRHLSVVILRSLRRLGNFSRLRNRILYFSILDIQDVDFESNSSDLHTGFYGEIIRTRLIERFLQNPACMFNGPAYVLSFLTFPQNGLFQSRFRL